MRKVQDESEIRVEERTAELEKITEELQRELTERRQVEKDLHKSEKRLQERNKVLVKLASSRALEQGGLEVALGEITEATASTLEVDRVNIWLYNEDRSKIHCIEQYELTKGRHSKGYELSAADYPSYFKALEEERTIAAHNAHTDPRTREFSESYLTPCGITSLLDAQIRAGGRMVGVICHENVGPARQWTLDEQNFAGSMADFVSLALEAWERKRAEEELERSLSLLRATLESTADGILVVDREGNIVSFNRTFLNMWSIPDSIIESRDDNQALKFVLDQLKDPEAFLKKVMELYNQPDAESYDVLELKHGSMFERYSQPQRIGEVIVGRVWSFRDVTERKRIEQALRESEERYRTLVQHTYDLIIEASIDGRFLYVSSKHEDLLGYEPRELVGKNIFEHIHPDDRAAAINEFTRVMRTLSSGHVVFKFKHKNGEWRWLESAGKPFKSATGEIRAVIASRDITERIRAEDALKESLVQLSKKNRYETIISAVTRSVHQSINLQDVLENAVDAMSKNIDGAENVAIFLVEGNEAVIKAYRGFPDWFVDRVKRVPYPKGATWKTIVEGKPTYSPDAEKDKVIGPAGREMGTKSYLSMPIQFEGETVGVININSFEKNAFDEEELKLLEIVSQQIQVAINNARQAEALRQSEEALRESLAQLSKKNRYETIISTVTRSVHQSTNLQDVIDNAVQSISENIDRADSVAIYLVEGEEAVLKAHRGFTDWYIERVGRIPYPKGYAWRVIMDEKPRYSADVDEDTVIGPAGREFGIKSYLSMPIRYEGKTIGVININSFEKNAFDEEELKLLEIVTEQITVALGNARQKGALQEALSEVERLKNRLQTENLYLQGEVKTEHSFEEIIGRSASLQKALFKVEQAASTNASVLIQGESGTGKELVARAIHDISTRRDRPLVKVNFAALPKNQIESELFGREEKGAFSSVLSLTIGRFELANGGTILLDEITDLPLEIQPKLIRILQEGEVKRLESSRTIKVDVRVIAATSRDLEQAVKTGNFREDLYHELSVFQIKIPPLRERKEDIPLLAKHFVMKHGTRIGKKIEVIPQGVMDILQAYLWPGNVRELENIIEQAVILTNGPTLELDEKLGIGTNS